MAYTQDQVASAIITEGQTARTTGTPETLHGVITPRGIQIALATAIVESNDQVLANPNVPESENYPNDGDGFDHASVGPFQQQNAWWGTVAEEMDPRLSAAMFYNHLEKLDYNGPNSPGSYAQAVQGSAFPDRYDQHFQEAVDQYNRLVGNAPTPSQNFFREFNLIDGYPNFQSRNGQKPRLFILHTEEGGMLGKDLADWMANNSVSYHYIVDNDGTAYDLVDTDDASWSVLDANDYTINLVFAGSFVAWSRNEWLANMENGIKIAAYICAQDCHKYGIPPVIRVGGSANGYSSLPTNDGVTDHYGITVGLHIGTHIDVGPGFPWDVFDSYLQQFYSNIESDDMFSDADRTMLQAVYDELTKKFPSRSPYREPNEGVVDTGFGMLLNDDGMEHAATVERLAVLGDADSLRRVIRAAAGEGAVTDAAFVERAKAVLAQVPPAILQAYEDAHK